MVRCFQSGNPRDPPGSSPHPAQQDVAFFMPRDVTRFARAVQSKPVRNGKLPKLSCQNASDCRSYVGFQFRRSQETRRFFGKHADFVVRKYWLPLAPSFDRYGCHDPAAHPSAIVRGKDNRLELPHRRMRSSWRRPTPGLTPGLLVRQNLPENPRAVFNMRDMAAQVTTP